MYRCKTPTLLIGNRAGGIARFNYQVPRPTPYTLHPTPYTLHPTPYTLHPKP